MDVQTAATIESLRERFDAATARAESLSSSIIAACEGSGCLNAHELRVALDRERSRAEVLAAEVRAWREFEDVSIDTSWHNAWCDSCDRIETVKSHTDRTHALDAAKFEEKK